MHLSDTVLFMNIAYPIKEAMHSSVRLGSVSKDFTREICGFDKLSSNEQELFGASVNKRQLFL
jgi:hypothetical protein